MSSISISANFILDGASLCDRDSTISCNLSCSGMFLKDFGMWPMGMRENGYALATSEGPGALPHAIA